MTTINAITSVFITISRIMFEKSLLNWTLKINTHFYGYIVKKMLL